MPRSSRTRPVPAERPGDDAVDVHVRNGVGLTAGRDSEPEGAQFFVQGPVMVMSATTRSPSATIRSITFADRGAQSSAARRLKSSVPDRPVTWL